MVKIKETDYGIASRINNTIYINRKLKKYPVLYDNIIKHEKKHSKGFTLNDLYIDFRGNYISPKKDYYKFILTHPSSWLEFLPVIRMNKKIVFNPTMIVLWLFISFWFYLIIKLLIYFL